MSTEQIKPGYKRTEVGVIPEDWSAHPLGELARSITRGASPRPIDNPKWFDERSKVGWVRISDVTKSGRYLAETTQRLSEAGIRHSRFVPAENLIMSICATVGRPIETQIDVCIHDGFVVFDKLSIEKSFLYYALTDLEPRWSRKGQTGSQMNLNTELIKGTIIAVPSSDNEQSAIASALSDMDALLVQLDQLIAKKRDLKQAAMQQLLTGQTRLPGFSGEWKVKRIDQICSLRTERIDPRTEGAQEFCIELEHIEPASGRLLGSSTASEQASLKTKFKVGDVLFGKLRAYQRKHWIASLPGVCSTEIWVLISNPEFSTPEFLYHLVSTDDFIEAASTAYGTHMPRSDWKVVRQVQVALPGLDEQTAIATVLSDMDAELATLEARRDKTRDLKQGMMQELLTGRIRLV